MLAQKTDWGFCVLTNCCVVLNFTLCIFVLAWLLLRKALNWLCGATWITKRIILVEITTPSKLRLPQLALSNRQAEQWQKFCAKPTCSNAENDNWPQFSNVFVKFLSISCLGPFIVDRMCRASTFYPVLKEQHEGFSTSRALSISTSVCQNLYGKWDWKRNCIKIQTLNC